jgi:DNA-binding beta-propeller fold protein YncE
VVVSATVGARVKTGQLDVLQVGSGPPSLVRTVSLSSVTAANGLGLSHDGKWLVVATSSIPVVVVSIQELLDGSSDPVVGTLIDAEGGPIEAAFSTDDRYVFAADETGGMLSIFDVAAAIQSNFTAHTAAIGSVPLGPAPVGIAVSPDGDWIYVTTEGDTSHPGMLRTIDEHVATQRPAAAVVAHIGAGCDPVRVALSPAGDLAWVTARASNLLLGFSTADLRADPSKSLRATVRVGQEPTGLALFGGGRYVLITNSARFVAPRQAQSATVVDLTAALDQRPAIIAWLAAGAFPREAAVYGSLGLVTNYNSASVDVYNLPT